MVSGEALKKLQEQIAAWPMTQRFVVQQLIEDYRRNREDLRAYKATGLTPEQCENAKAIIEAAFSDDTSKAERIRELLKADKDGRLVVRPYRLGVEVYVLLEDCEMLYPETNGWYIGKETIGAITPDGFYLGDPADDCFTPDSEIGKTVFLTSEEAKKALEARKGE